MGTLLTENNFMISTIRTAYIKKIAFFRLEEHWIRLAIFDCETELAANLDANQFYRYLICKK